MRQPHGGHTDPRVLDFSASVAPLGPPAAVLAALADLPALIERYPDPDAAALCEAAARHHGIPPESVLAGNGTADLIYLIAQELRGVRVHLVRPCFAEYGAACVAMGAALASSPDGAAATFAANPASPAGSLTPASTFLALPGLRVIDEAFMGFTDERESLVTRAAHMRDLIVLRSLTKTYSIPGLRVGYLVSHPDVVARLRSRQPPWSTSALAIAAGVAALGDTTHIERVRETVLTERKRLRRDLEKLGIEVSDGRANFLLCRVASSSRLRARLLERGIAVRDCTSFDALAPDRYVRIAVRTAHDNARLLAALSDLIP